MPIGIRSNILELLDDILILAATDDDLIDVINWSYFPFVLSTNSNYTLENAHYSLQPFVCVGDSFHLMVYLSTLTVLTVFATWHLFKQGVELKKFVCAMQWMHSTVPTFSFLIRPLTYLLEKVYILAGKRT